MLHRGRKRADGLNGIHAKQDPTLVQRLADGINIDPEPGDEMTGSQGDQAGIFVNLADHIDVANHTQIARVQVADLDSLLGQCHPGIDIGGIIIVVNENVPVLPKR